MSEGDVSGIRDEDVLRRMWQQTEDFGRKKEIRAHMYRLREERLRTLYSPEPRHDKGKGVEAMHVTSLQDQSFQGLKSKEVRDAGSPPKDFGRQDLTPLSTAGWNVQTEQRSSADGLTSSRAVRADVQGGYDVEGGRGKFAAVDSHRQVHSEYQDGNTSVKKDEATSKTAHNEHVLRQTDDGTHFSSTKSSSTSSSNFQQVSSTTEVPYTVPDESVSRSEYATNTKTSDYEKTLRSSNFESGELISRKVDYPDDNTKVIVETRCLPDGTRITSTRKEFCTPVQSTQQQHSSRSESRSYSNTSHRADTRESSTISREYDIVDAQRQADDYDFKRNRVQDDNSQTQRNIQKTSDTKRFESKDSSSKIIRETVDRQNISDSKFDTTDSSTKFIRETVDRKQDISDSKLDTKDISSKIIRETVDRRQDISDTQKHVDDFNYKRNVQIDQNTRSDDIRTEKINQRYETKTDTNRREIITSDDKRDQHTDYSTIHRIDRHDAKVDETDRREVISSRDKQNIERDVKESNNVKNNEERIHNITRDQKVEDIVEKKSSDQYQTTYQTDYSQKKISNDWSPSHQAWASTLRGDSPASARPTTRASSPGSRTHQSSTSSLRSSVSPDKGCRKPPSRGGSPNKTDRSSPSRYSTDRYSSTTSTHSVTESRNYKHTSPDRKPPKSPTRYGSPDSKPDGYRQRPSQSPEKRPQEFRPSSSPERKPGSGPTDGYPRTTSPSRPVNGTPRSSASPDRKPTYHPSERPDSGYPHATSPVRSSPENKFPQREKDISFGRPSTSPDRKPGYKPSPASTPSDYPRTVSPTRPYAKDSARPSASPDRKPGYEHPTPSRVSGNIPKDSSPTRPSASPDRKPSYMRPTASSQTPDRKSPTKHEPSQSPERKPYSKTTVKEDHYKFIDAETKMYTRTDREDTSYTKMTSASPDRFSGPRDQSPSPRSPDDVPDYSRADSPSLRSSLRKGSRSPSPPKGPVTFTDDHIDRTEKTKFTSSDVTKKHDEDITKTSKHTRDVPREPSPTKYGTYDKKRRTEETEEVTSFTTRKDTTDVKYDSLTRRDKTTKKTETPLSPTKTSPKEKSTDAPRETSPIKYGTYDKKRRSEEVEEITSTTKNTTDIKYDSLTRKKSDSRKVPESPTSPIKKHPRESVSPAKSPTKDTKYKHTTDFITTERTTEEINKKTVSKDRPRQLVTPSTSPTRKPKTDDTAPSTGQSSPTTSVSGFVYFSSPKTEKTIVTDLDDEVYFSTVTQSEEFSTNINERPKTLNVERSPSPSKIPCRSPSVEVKKTPTKDSLPRKSSLKKPSTESINLSPDEKPPSSFRVSPTDEVPQHKIVKKDRPDKPVDSPIKPKAPFERRETYEERCLKILGVVDDDTQTESSETLKLRSSSVSPCRSPGQKESSPLGFYTDTKEINSVSEFISKEQDDTTKKTITRFEDTLTSNRNLRTPSREPSPAKLQDIISQKKVTKHSETEDVQRESISKITRDSPNRDIGYQKPRLSVSPEKKFPQTVKDSSPVRSSQSPERKHQVPKSLDSVRSTSPAKSVPLHGTPTKTNHQPTKSSPVKPAEEQPKEKSPTRPSVSPDRKPGYMKSTASTTHKYESLETSENHETSVRRTNDKETGYWKTKDESPHRPSTSPEKEPGYCLPSTTTTFPDKKKEKSPNRSSVSPDKTPGYMRPTAATITKFEETSMVEDMTVDSKDVTTSETIHKHSITKVPEKTSRSGSPTKKPGEVKQPRTQSPSKKTTSTTDDTTLLIQSEREREVLDRVQQSLRKLSPSREQRSPSREKSPGKSISLQDIDVVTTETNQTSTKVTKEDIMKTSCEKGTSVKTDVTRTVRPSADKPKDQKPVTKTPSRTVSPTKKPTSPTKQDSSPDSTDKSRSISPKKPLSPTERSQSPHVSKPSGIKPREPTPSSLLRKPSGNMSPPKVEKVTTDTKKTTSITKQNSTSKIATKTTTSRIPSSTTKTEPEPKRAPTPKGINKENVSPRKDEVKVTRTASDTSLKNKKPSPQRMKSKPEIQVNDLSPTRTPKTSNLKKPSGRDTPTRLAPKPKSATALNSTKDDDEIIIDVEQAKSSRENSPDRICPTPVSFLEDVGTPRYPDDVCEPDDDFRNRTHHTIHETESIVDDIVEISEDDELFVKKTDMDHITKSDECLLSVTDKVSKFTNKIETITKPKDSTTFFKDTERRVHSDFINENLKSDECLLSVSEKVNKFAKGPQEKRDKSPSRRIVDEFDTETVYQDDYTKLSVNDKAHLFIETAENVKAPKTRPAQKVERPDLTDVDESLKSDECLMSVSDKVHKFVKTAEQFLQESHETEDKERKVKEQYEKFMQQLGQDDVEDTQITKTSTEFTKTTEVKDRKPEDKTPSFAKETASSHTKVKEYASPNLKPAEKTPTVKITTLRSSEAVKKAKALFENIATTQQTKETKTTKLLDIGVTMKSPKTDSTTVLHPSVEDLPYEPETEVDGHYKTPSKERPVNGTSTRSSQPRYDDRRSSPSRHMTQSPEVPRTKSPSRQSFETTTTTKTVLSRYPAAQNETPKKTRPDIEKVPKRAPEPKQASVETEKPFDKIPSYQRPTATSQIKEEKTVEETEATNRRGSGKFGVELRRTSVERSTVSSERRRSSADHHQPCIEDIFDLDLLEQMLEKVVGYEQRRRIRAQIRVARKKLETKTDTTYSRHTKQTTTTTKTRSPERRPQTKSPERHKSTPIKTEHYTSSIPQKSTPQSDHSQPKEHSRPMTNGHAKEPGSLSEKRQRPQSPEKPRPALKTQSSVRQPSPEKKLRTASPTKVSPKPKSNRFSEYASAYMKKVGLNETDKVKLFNKTKATTDTDDIKTRQSKTSNNIDYEDHTTNKVEEHSMMQTKSTSMSKSFSERTSSKETIEVVHVNGKRSPSPEKKRSPTRHIQSPSERLYQRSPSPDFKRKNDLNKKETIIKTVYETEPRVTKKETIIRTVVEERPKVESKKETIIKTVYDIEKKMTPKQTPEEKPSWAVNRNLKKVSAESRAFSSRRAEERKPASPGKALARPIDAVVSSYGPGPLDADGRPLFGIKALRNGSSNYQVKGTVIRQEFHSRNGGEPEGSVSVTAYSTEPEDLERLLQCQGEKPSRIHGLAAITTTKKFGGETGTTLKEAHSKEERAALDQFTHNERRVSEDVEMRESRIDREGRERAEERTEKTERREDKKTVRQSSVKSLTEKYIKSASDTSKSERAAYPKAGLILRTATLKDSVSSDSSAHAGDTSESERAAYPKAGLILRTATLKDSVSSDSSAHAGLGRTSSAHSLGSVDDQTTVTSPQTPPAPTRREARGEERSFLDSSTKVTGVQDILTRMRNADIVIEDGDTTEDSEARALLNKFLGATVLMAGMQGYMQPEKPAGSAARRQETTRTSSSGKTSSISSRRVEEVDLERCWDERLLRKLLEESSDYEQRRRIRARIRNLMAEQEACATAVSEALGAGSTAADDAREEAEVTVTSSVRRDSSEKTVSSSTTTKSSRVIESSSRPAAAPAPKTVSPFAKFRQLEKQNSLNSPNSPQSPKSPSQAQAPYFKFTDPALQASALTIKERLLQWCRDKTRDYENVKLENFSTSWADGLAFCALVHHFLPTAFDYSQLTPQQRRHNFTLAFKVADEKAGIYPLLDVDDMVAMRKPDWKCVFTYVQAIHRRFKDEP